MKYSLTKSESFQLVHCEALKSQIPTKDNLLVPCAQDGIVLANQFVQSFTSLVLKGIPPNQTHVQSPIPLPPSPSHQRKVLFFNNTGKCQANLVLQLNMSYFPTKGECKCLLQTCSASKAVLLGHQLHGQIQVAKKGNNHRCCLFGKTAFQCLH